MSYTERAKRWYTRAVKEKDQFVKFLLFYIALEASIKPKSIRDLKSDPAIKKCVSDNIPVIQLTELKNILDKQPLVNMKPNGDIRWNGTLSGINDSDGIIEYIIRARNNLFHGDKEPDDMRDLQVIEWANLLINPIIKTVIK